MRIYIEKSEKVTRTFIKYLIRKIKLNLAGNLNVNKLIAVQTKLSEMHTEFESVDVVNAFYKLLLNVIYRETENGFFIEINPYVFLGRKIRLYDYWKFITYGTLEIQGYPLVVDVFSDIVYNINDYYEKFKVEAGGITCL